MLAIEADSDVSSVTKLQFCVFINFVSLSPHTTGVYVIRIVIEIPPGSDIFAGVGPRQDDQDQERVDNFVNQVHKIEIQISITS